MKFLVFVILLATCVVQNESGFKEDAEKAVKGFEGAIDKLSEALEALNKTLEDGTKDVGSKFSEQLDKIFNPVFDAIAAAAGPQNKECVDAQKKDAQEKREEKFQNGLLCITNIVTEILGYIKNLVDAISANEKAIKAIFEAFGECLKLPPPQVPNCFAMKTVDPIKTASDANSKALITVKDLATIQLKIPNSLADCVSEQLIGAEKDSVAILLELTKCSKPKV